MSGEAYQEYLESDHWKHLRLLKIKEVGKACQACKRTKSIVVHHARYSQGLLNTTINDLLVLCEECHNAFHRHLANTRQRLESYTSCSTLEFLSGFYSAKNRPCKPAKVISSASIVESLVKHRKKVPSKKDIRAFIKALRAEIGGFTKINCNKLGVPYPLCRKWKRSLLEKALTDRRSNFSSLP